MVYIQQVYIQGIVSHTKKVLQDTQIIKDIHHDHFNLFLYVTQNYNGSDKPSLIKYQSIQVIKNS